MNTIEYAMYVVITIIFIILACLIIEFTENRKQKKGQEAAASIARYKDYKIANQSPMELETYLAVKFSRCMEIEAITRISDVDPDRSTKLFAAALARLTDLLGADTIEAIEYYYGAGYINRFCEIGYRIMDQRGAINRLLTRSGTADDALNNVLDFLPGDYGNGNKVAEKK